MAFRHASDQVYKCPICGKENNPHETFRCRRCSRQYLCSDHLNPNERVCEECVSIKPRVPLEERGMVLIHEGEFFMGVDDDEESPDAAPLHAIRLEQFLIDKELVTNAQYKKFKPDFQFPAGAEDEPVTGVNFFDAKAYAESLGKRLLTEPEWEKAARSRDKRPYPWGDEVPREAIEAGRINLREALKKINLSPYMVRDMSGGPWEWIDSTYEPYPNGNTAIHGYYEGNKVIRGGQITSDKPAKTFQRSYAQPADARPDISFRCCKGKPQVYDPIYAGTDIKRPKRADVKDTPPPPEFKALHTKEDRMGDVIKKVEMSGLTKKDIIQKSKEEMEQMMKEKQFAEAGQRPFKRKTAAAAPKATPVAPIKDEDWIPEAEKPPVPWALIIGLIVVLAAVGGYFYLGKGASASNPKIPDAIQFDPPVVKIVRLSAGNVAGPTSISVLKGDRVTISVQGWSEGQPAPPLVAHVGQSSEIAVGGSTTFISAYDGEIQLRYKGGKVVPLSGRQTFDVSIKVEKKKSESDSGGT
jgi:hypothetical protein